ncbi:MAG TPA: hypothetical protein VGU45_13710 [Microvirga sp.]|jgi:hypothetical protein|nr:hypothetical protein [Microvirga sp.]
MNLSAELERLAARDYREEGIPMLIVADGLASEAGAAPDLADAFGRLASHLPPGPGEADIARLLEALADAAFGPDALSRARQH